MKKIFTFTVILSSMLFADHTSIKDQTCNKCHPQIVEEFESSMHRNSTYYNDEIHKAVWDKHPLKEQGKYSCAECHAPEAKNEDDIKNGITCISCHTIKNIEEHEALNKNIYSDDKKTFFSAEAGREGEKVKYKTETSMFGLSKKTVGSPYHNLDYTNEIYYNGKVCMGCHSHRQNSHGFDLCKTDDKAAGDTKENCITCHMPKVEGSATTIRESKTHAYHGFAGIKNGTDLLSKYVELSLNKKADSFDIVITSNSPHALLTHPLRVLELRVNLLRDGKKVTLDSTNFSRVIGDDGKPTMPWLAKEVVSDTMIKAKEKRAINYNSAIKAGDALEVTLGFYSVNPKSLEKLGLKGNKSAENFTVLKHQYFDIK